MAYSVLKRSAFVVVAVSVVGCHLAPPQEQNPSKFNPAQLIRKTGNSVGNALRIESRVIKAKDPTALDYDAGPIKPSLHVSAASVMQNSGKFEEARLHYMKALEVEPSNRAALIGVARLHHQTGELDKAIAAYRHATQVLGNDAVILNDLALCQSRAERYDESIASLRSALSLKPDSLMYQNNLAAVLIQAGRTDEAVGVLSDLHGPAVAHYNVGYLLNRSGEPAAASAHFVRSLQANPSFEPARLMLDRVLPEVGQRPIERVAKVPDAAVTSLAPQRVPTVHGLPGEPRAEEGAAAEVATDVLTSAVPTGATIQHVDFNQPIHDGLLESGVNVAEPPPIRLPEPGRRRPHVGPGSFVPPAPATP